jgi:hypothetical protein
MVRWYITANDTNNVSSRWPLFPDPLNSPQYLGTIIDDLSLTSNLPILHWFVEYPAEADTWTGTRCSMFFIGHFYDNVFVRIRGGTSSYLEKKNHKFVFNKGHYFLFSDDQIRVEKANINAAYVDTSYMREILSQELSTKAGVPSCYTFPLRLQQNGDFHSLAIFVEQVDDRFLERHGLDPDGSLYKAAINDTVFDNAYDFEAKNGSDYLDLVNLVDGLNLSGSERTNYIFDNLNIPEIISYLAINVITSEYDHTHKNYYMHFDTELGRWYIFPWDKDLSWGNIWLGTYIVTDLDVFYGGSKNILFDAIYSEPKTREMFLRRLRTLMDEILEPSSTPPSQRQIENRINELHSTMKPEADLDRAVWGFTNHPWYTGFEQVYFNDGVALLTDQYLPARRNFLYVINAVMNGGEIPNSQPPNPLINIDPDIEFNPPSGNQDEEYIRLNNPNAYAIDISGFKLTGAVKHTFQPGVVVPAGDSLYVSPNVNAFRARTTSPSGNEGLFVQGNYSGHLSSWGETINLLDTDSNLVDTYTYPPSPSDQQRHLRITEMMYHPADPNQPSPYNDEDFEFIELKNIGPNVLDLNGVKFTDGIDYEFPGPKTYNTTLITPDDVWKYNQYGTDLGTTWRMPDYNDSSWPLGAAVLYDETVSPWPPEPWIKNTNLTVELGKITFYFRKHFYLDADPTVDDITLQLYTLIDDGVVLYLNGVEVKRLGMPDGTITYSTLADRTVYDAVTEGPFTIPSSNLVAGENVLAAEVHQITSTSSDIVLGLMLEATISTHTPNVILDPNEYVLLVKDHNAFASRYPNVSGVEILGPYDGQLSNNGEKIKLEDFTNSTILEFDYKDDWYPVTDGAGFSLVIFDSNDPNLDSWDDKESWHPSIVLHGSPGQDDPPPVQNPADIVANEVLAHSHALDPDWIELHNTTETSIDIGGWFLSDDKDDLTKYEISSGTSIDANGYRVFYQDTNFGDTSTDPGCHTPFALSENGETVYLSSGSGGQLAGGFSQKQDFGASETSVSFGLYQKSTGQYDFVPMDSTTPGYDNDYPKVGPVVITEVMYNPQSGDQNAEYIELYNTTASLVPLYDPATTVPWKFTDGVEFTFPPGITLEAGRHLLLVKDIPTFNSEYGSMPPGVQLLGPYDGQLDNGGENLQISMPGDVDESGTRYYICIDHLDYDNDYPWPGQADANGFSLTRIDPNLYGNDVINWDANTPSPGIAAP